MIMGKNRKESISLQELTIGYATRQGTSVVAGPITAQIPQGELICLLGPNGVGKSTLLRTLAAFQPPVSGQIIFHLENEESRDLNELSDRQLSRLIGVVLTEKPAVKNMSVSELVALGRSPYTGFWGTLEKEDKQVVKESIEAIGIMALADRMVETLSDGERQKVMIAKALAQQTPIILLDEPTAFLDFPSKVEVMQLLRQLAHSMQKTIFMSTHDLELALQVADSLWLMERGQLNIGTARELADNNSLSHFVERDGIVFDRSHLTVKVL